MIRSPEPSTRFRPFGFSPSARSAAIGFRANNDRIISDGKNVGGAASNEAAPRTPSIA
jgi:hypothetical protein